MRSRLLGAALVVAVSLATISRAGGNPLPVARTSPQASGSSMVQQLKALSDRYWARVAGRDTSLPAHVNGHDEFAAAWTHQMLGNLKGIPAAVVRQPFPTSGFRSLPAKHPGVNVIVTVPGSRHPNQAVVIGAHYDGEPDSKGSAFDDASGSIIMLGLAHTLGALWRAHGLPSLTVEFVLFDAEEEGLIGSGFFAFAYQQDALMPKPVLMINEEQSGVGYPMRPFGLRSGKPTPSYAITTGQLEGFLEPVFGRLTHPSPKALAALLKRLTAARSSTFQKLRTVYPSLQYRGGRAKVFTDADRRYLQMGPIPQCCSDNDPFDALGIPSVTFSGNYDYYTRHRQPWSYPFDQPQDTFAALACDVAGTPRPNPILAAALDLPLRLSATLLQDYAPPVRGAGMAIFSTIPRVGALLHLQVVGAGPIPITWNFGDGTHASGTAVTHTYSAAGSYLVSIRTRATTDQWRLTVPQQNQAFVAPLKNVAPPGVIPWHPRQLKAIRGCP
jgi:Peptidase family M28/PKD domain